MATIGLLYGANNQAITITLASLGNGSARASTAIANTGTVPFEDLLVQIKVKSGASGTSATGVVNVYATGSVDGGTSYGEGATGTDAAITLTNPPNVRLIGTINLVANATTEISTPMSVAAAFGGGSIPDHVVIIVQNNSGSAFDATAGNFAAFYQGVQHQSQ